MSKNKKKEFMAKREKKRATNRVVFGLIGFVFLFVMGVLIINDNKDAVVSFNRWDGGDYNIGQQVDYSGQIIGQSDVELLVEDGKAMISLADVEENSFIYTEYNVGGFRLPLMAYICPSGRVVAGISYCEPCRSQRFHINGDELVCDNCNTRWSLSGDLRGLSGGCLDYPPEEIDYEVIGDMIVIKESDIRSWTPRDSSGM